MYKRTIESSRAIADEAMKFFASRVKAQSDGILVFNPTGSTRSSVVEFDAPAGHDPRGQFMTDGKNDVHVGTAASGRCMLLAENLPPYGYRVYMPSAFQAKLSPAVQVSDDLETIENDEYRVKIDAARGVVTSVFDKKANREAIRPGGSGNRLEVHWEEPNGMSAWTIGTIKKVEPLVGPVKLQLMSDFGQARTSIKWDRQFQSTVIHQVLSLPAHGPPEFAMSTDWKELGGSDKLCPFLKVAFDINTGEVAKFTSQIPFGTIERPINNVEVPAGKWADLTGSAGGAAILNDCKQGYSAEKNTLRLSLIRSSYWPDPRPNDRPQSAKWIFHAHGGNWQAANIIPEAEAFNHPLLTTTVAPNKAGTLPPQGSMLSIGADNVIVTGLKRAEDDNDLVIRFYEANGKQTHVEPKLAFDVGKVATVNLIEDKLADEKGLAVDLRPHEIRTLKITTKGGDGDGGGKDARQPAADGQ
jgi:alpha-mannosidase